MKRTRKSRSGFVVAAIGTALAGWSAGDTSFVHDLAARARLADAPSALHRLLQSSVSSASASDANAAGVTALLGATALAAPAPSVPAATAAQPTPKPAAASGGQRDAAIAALDIRLIEQRLAPAAATKDAFSAKSWFVAPPPPPPPPPAAPPPPPPPPQAPPLPFKYMGMLQESADRTVWYLTQGERLIVAATGEVIDATYRIDGFEAGQLRLTYLPLEQPQTLVIGEAP